MSDAEGIKTNLDRRTFLRTGTAALAGLGLGGAGLSLVGCERSPAEATGSAAPSTQAASSGGPAREMNLAAGRLETEVGPGRVWHTWGYDGQYPGPEIRVKEGERLRVTVENQLPDAGTTVHWHGVPVPNAMDGVPGVTQEPIPPGEAMT
jgi:FtsP/CotA-like multicopper oxidase with cupredoxin domain